MSFDPSTAKLVESAPEPSTSRFDPSKGVKLIEEPAAHFDPSGGVTKVAEGEGVSLLDYMMRGLGTYGEAMASQELPKQGVPAITVPRFGQEGTFTRGVSEGVSGLIEGTTTPEGIVAGALMPAAPITSKAIAPLFLAAGAKITGQKAGEYSVTQNPQALGEAATIGAATLLGAAAEARVAARPTPEPTPELQRLAPETAKAVEEVAKPEPKPEGAPDATQITSTDALDVRQPPENGPRMGEGNAPPERPAETPAPEATQQPIAQPEAVAAEAPVPQFTAIKNARLDAQRADRGLPPLMEPLRKSDPVLWDQAMKQIEADPTISERLTKELLEKPRPMTDVEAVVMDHRMADLKNQLDQFRWEGSKAGDAAKAADDARRAATTPEARQAAVLAEKEARAKAAELDAQALELSNALTLVEQAVGKQSVEGGPGAGTLMGRAFRARQLLMREDFSYAGLELQKRQANQFQPLNANQLAEVRRTAEEYKAKADVYEERLKTQVEATAKAEAAKELAELRVKEAKAQAAMTGRVKALVGRVGEVLDTRANAARQRLQGKLLSLSPADLKDVAEIAAANLYHIGMDLGTWSAKMIGEFGEAIKPHLDYLWKEAQRILDESVTGEAKAPVPGKRGKAATAKDEAAVQEAIRKRIRKRIEDYEARIKAGDYSPWRKPAKKMDKQTLDAFYQLERVKRQFHEGLMADRAKQATPIAKTLGRVRSIGDAIRAWRTSGDLSGFLRQGFFVVVAHPVRGAKSVPAMLKAAFSERQAFKAEQDILNRDNYPLYRSSGLFIAERGTSLSRMEEAYMSQWTSKIPLVAGSERAYVTVLNQLRADSFDALAKTLGRKGEVTTEQAKILSNAINIFTGRGSLGRWEMAGPALASAFFSPRYVLSRFQLLVGQPLWYGIPSGKLPWFADGAGRARLLIAKEYGKILTGAGILFGLGMTAGGDVETDRRSSDFAKLH